MDDFRVIFSPRTKRGTTRDKYSPFDDVFMKNYVHNSKNKSQSEGASSRNHVALPTCHLPALSFAAARSTCNSMASSVISDG